MIKIFLKVSLLVIPCGHIGLHILIKGQFILLFCIFVFEDILSDILGKNMLVLSLEEVDCCLHLLGMLRLCGGPLVSPCS